MQSSMDLAISMIYRSVEQFEAAEKELLQRYASSPVLVNIRNFVDGCKYACTGNLNWRYVLHSM